MPDDDKTHSSIKLFHMIKELEDKTVDVPLIREKLEELEKKLSSSWTLLDFRIRELKNKINYIDSIKTPFELFMREVKDNQILREVLRDVISCMMITEYAMSTTYGRELLKKLDGDSKTLHHWMDKYINKDDEKPSRQTMEDHIKAWQEVYSEKKDGEKEVGEMSNKGLRREESNNDILPPSKPSELKKLICPDCSGLMKYYRKFRDQDNNRIYVYHCTKCNRELFTDRLYMYIDKEDADEL